MKVNPEDFDKYSDAFIDEFLALLKKHKLHDNQSKITVNSNGFRLDLKGTANCKPQCVRTVTQIGPNGKLIKVRTCVC